MPALFYGSIKGEPRQLYASNIRPIETSVFDHLKVNDLAPYGRRAGLDIANFWWIKKHTAISWHDARMPKVEQTILLPGRLSHADALFVARTEFPRGLMPPALTFRWNNPKKVFLYD